MTRADVESLARFLFYRQAESYGATEALRDLAWADRLIRAFWIKEAEAILGHLEGGES